MICELDEGEPLVSFAAILGKARGRENEYDVMYAFKVNLPPNRPS
jgi:hypothetical protein